MLSIENTEVFGWDAAIRGMRNPKNSWAKSDSGLVESFGKTELSIGHNDHKLMMQLRNAGTDHRKFMRMITVSMDVTAPLYWWKEADQYKVGTITNSCSTMHKLMSKPFEMGDFSFDKLPGFKNEIKQYPPKLSEEMIAKETWVNINGEYQVSDLGRIRHIFKDHHRIISGSLHNDGYIFVTIGGEQRPAHRYVAKAFHEDTYFDGAVVNHIDGNKQNNMADNLEWVTQSENVAHSIRNGLAPAGLSRYTGKFSPDEREEIKRMWNDGALSKRAIARKLGVSHQTICAIINDKYKYAEIVNLYEEIARPLVDTLNELRDSYLCCSDEAGKKRIWYSVIQLLPSSYNQRRTMLLNYEVLANIYKSRRNHKLDEWHTFCEWCESLPYSELITGETA